MDYSAQEAACATDVGVGAPGFADMFPDPLLLDSSGADMASLILGLEKDLSAAPQQEHQSGNSSWSSLLPAHSATLPLGCNVALPAAKYVTVGNWHNNSGLISDHTAAAVQATADACPSQTGSECTAMRDGGFLQLMHDVTTAVPMCANFTATAATTQLPFSIVTLGRRDSAAGGSSTVQCTSPGSAGSPRACSTGGFSAGLLSGSEDSSMHGLDASAAVRVAGRPASSSGAAAVAAAAASSGQNKRKAANLVSQRKLRQKRQEETEYTKEQMSTLYSKNSDLQERVDALRAENSNLLNRMSDITNKWQATVVENARLNQENGRVSAQLVELQHQLAVAQREVEIMRITMQQQQQQQQQSQLTHQQQLQQQQQQRVTPQQQPHIMHQQQHGAGLMAADVWSTAGPW